MACKLSAFGGNVIMQEDTTRQSGETAPLSVRIKQAIDTKDRKAFETIFSTLSRSEALRELLHLSEEARGAVLSGLPPSVAADIIEEAPNELAVELIEILKADTAADIIEELDSDIQADVIGEMDEPDANAILSEMGIEDARDVRRLVVYDDETAGGLMLAEAFTFNSFDKVQDVLHRLATTDEDFERYRGQHPYIVDTVGRLVGVVSLRALLTANRYALLSSIMTSPIAVRVDTSLDDLNDLFVAHPFLGLPVIEADGTLAGVVSRTAVDSAILERTESESMRRQGIVGDELRSMPLLLRSRRRLAWLSTNILLNVIAASVISAYEETIAAVIAIAVFLPMVSDMSGCSGNQAVAVSIRELSLGLIKPVDALRVWYKEVSVGVINGLLLGLLIGVVVWIWKGNIYLGGVIGFALALNTLLSVSIGGVVPLLIKRFGQDPSAASGPLLTTVTDMAGFFLVLSLASLFLPVLK